MWSSLSLLSPLTASRYLIVNYVSVFKDESKEEGEHTDRASEERELSEDELQNRRMLLLQQLQEQQED